MVTSSFKKKLINFELKKKQINLYFLQFTFYYLLDARLCIRGKANIKGIELFVAIVCTSFYLMFAFVAAIDIKAQQVSNT